MNQNTTNPFEHLDAKLDAILREIRNKSSISSEELLSIDEAAKLLNLSKATIYGYTHNRLIPFKKISRRLYFSKSELIAWIERGSIIDHTTILNKRKVYSL